MGRGESLPITGRSVPKKNLPGRLQERPGRGSKRENEMIRSVEITKNMRGRASLFQASLLAIADRYGIRALVGYGGEFVVALTDRGPVPCYRVAEIVALATEGGRE